MSRLYCNFRGCREWHYVHRPSKETPAALEPLRLLGVAVQREATNYTLSSPATNMTAKKGLCSWLILIIFFKGFGEAHAGFPFCLKVHARLLAIPLHPARNLAWRWQIVVLKAPLISRSSCSSLLHLTQSALRARVMEQHSKRKTNIGLKISIKVSSVRQSYILYFSFLQSL